MITTSSPAGHNTCGYVIWSQTLLALGCVVHYQLQRLDESRVIELGGQLGQGPPAAAEGHL
jgi:hypothetical protein